MERYNIKNWARLALAVITECDCEPIDEDWENDLKLFVSYFYNMNNIKMKRPRAQYKPKVNLILKDPDFENYVTTHSKADSTKHYKCNVKTLLSVARLKGVIIPEYQQPSSSFVYRYKNDPIFNKDVHEMKLQEFCKKYKMRSNTFCKYYRLLKVERKGAHKK